MTPAAACSADQRRLQRNALGASLPLCKAHLDGGPSATERHWAQHGCRRPSTAARRHAAAARGTLAIAPGCMLGSWVVLVLGWQVHEGGVKQVAGAGVHDLHMGERGQPQFRATQRLMRA